MVDFGPAASGMGGIGRRVLGREFGLAIVLLEVQGWERGILSLSVRLRALEPME